MFWCALLPQRRLCIGGQRLPQKAASAPTRSAIVRAVGSNAERNLGADREYGTPRSCHRDVTVKDIGSAIPQCVDSPLSALGGRRMGDIYPAAITILCTVAAENAPRASCGAGRHGIHETDGSTMLACNIVLKSALSESNALAFVTGQSATRGECFIAIKYVVFPYIQCSGPDKHSSAVSMQCGVVCEPTLYHPNVTEYRSDSTSAFIEACTACGFGRRNYSGRKNVHSR
jgi:hypothetical protein